MCSPGAIIRNPPAAANTSHMPQCGHARVVVVRVRPRGPAGSTRHVVGVRNRYGTVDGTVDGTVTATGDGDPPGAPASRVPGAASAPAPAPAPARVWRREGEAV